MQSMDWAEADMVNQKAAELGFKDDWFLDPMESKKRQEQPSLPMKENNIDKLRKTKINKEKSSVRETLTVRDNANNYKNYYLPQL